MALRTPQGIKIALFHPMGHSPTRAGNSPQILRTRPFSLGPTRDGFRMGPFLSIFPVWPVFLKMPKAPRR